MAEILAVTDKAGYRVWTLLLPTGGLPKKVSTQLVEKCLRNWQFVWENGRLGYDALVGLSLAKKIIGWYQT